MRAAMHYMDDELGRRLGEAYTAAPDVATARGSHLPAEVVRARFVEEAVRHLHETAKDFVRQDEVDELAEVLRVIEQWQGRAYDRTVADHGATARE